MCSLLLQILLSYEARAYIYDKKELWDYKKLSRLGVCTESNKRVKKRNICLGGCKKYLMHSKSVLYINSQYPGN